MKRKTNRITPSLFRLSHLYESDYGLFGQVHFHELVDLETKRALRSGTVPLVLLMDLTGFEDEMRRDQVLRAVASVLYASTREADAKGWHRYPGVLGVLVTDAIATGTSLHSTKDAIASRLRARLAKKLTTHDVEFIGFSGQTVPSSADGSGNTQRTDSESPTMITPAIQPCSI